MVLEIAAQVEKFFAGNDGYVLQAGNFQIFKDVQGRMMYQGQGGQKKSIAYMTISEAIQVENFLALYDSLVLAPIPRFLHSSTPPDPDPENNPDGLIQK